MKSIAMVLLLVCFSCTRLQAQDQVSRGDIEILMQQKNEAFDQLERDCYQKFAVNDCVKEVNAKRRLELADLKRQDALLSATERTQRATEQLQRLEQKKREAQERSEEAHAIDAAAAEKQKKQLLHEKSEQHTQKLTQSTAAQRTVKIKEAKSPALIQKNQTDQQSKITEANRRRAERDKRLAERDLTIQGLPKPGSK